MRRAPAAGRSSTGVRSAIEASFGPCSDGTGTLGISFEAFFERLTSGAPVQAARRARADNPRRPPGLQKRMPMHDRVAWPARRGQVLALGLPANCADFSRLFGH